MANDPKVLGLSSFFGSGTFAQTVKKGHCIDTVANDLETKEVLLYDSKNKHFTNFYGHKASSEFASNNDYGDSGCMFCCDPKFRTSIHKNFPCLYCSEEFSLLEYPEIAETFLLYNSKNQKFTNPYGRKASSEFASNNDYGEPGCTFCRDAKCTLENKTDPEFRKSIDKSFPCLYCGDDFKTKDGVHDHQIEKHPFLFCPRDSSRKCDDCGNSYYGSEEKHQCPSPAK